MRTRLLAVAALIGIIAAVLFGATIYGEFFSLADRFGSDIGTSDTTATEAPYADGVLTYAVTVDANRSFDRNDWSAPVLFHIQANEFPFSESSTLCREAFDGNVLENGGCGIDFQNLARYPVTEADYHLHGKYTSTSATVDGRNVSVDGADDRIGIEVPVDTIDPIKRKDCPDWYDCTGEYLVYRESTVTLQFDIDADQDGVYTVDDACPDTAGTLPDGCPEPEPDEPGEDDTEEPDSGGLGQTLSNIWETIVDWVIIW